MATSQELAAQEERLQFDRFDNDTAIALGQRMLTAARERGLPLVISVRRNGQRLFHAALPGTSADNDAWVDRKARIVDRYGHSSYYMGMLNEENGGGSFEEKSRLDPELYAAHGGVFPVIVRGTGPIGTVGVSGLPQEEDHAFVVEQLEAFLGG
ncbi:heme-degrading domain-containing protein [Kibdelosporangium persicum]|uniref:UPF0303 protein GC106_43720 n=1 Tax=Kibdelosporangium persicum TaxID=2698649 RepID=A0ABX2F7L8_9PSEU|nr:heme-degrading domain-containing protein [Kibdelosporangium persicum]NRN67139.1 Heme-degrading domain-containing protein [Kibdelosporangium persicum]